MKTARLVVLMLAGMLMAGTADRVTATCWTCEGTPGVDWWCASVQGAGYLTCDPNGEVGWCKLTTPSYCETNPCPGCRKFPALRLPRAYVVILDAPAEARESMSSAVRVVDVMPGDLGQLGQIEAIVSRGAHPPVDPVGASIAGYAIISQASARELRFRSSEDTEFSMLISEASAGNRFRVNIGALARFIHEGQGNDAREDFSGCCAVLQPASQG